MLINGQTHRLLHLRNVFQPGTFHLFDNYGQDNFFKRELLLKSSQNILKQKIRVYQNHYLSASSFF